MLGVVGRGLARGEPAGPIADVEPVDLAADAPADDASRGFHRGALFFRQIGRQLQDRLDRLMPVETMAPRIEAELLDVVQLLQTAAFDGVVHGGFRLSLSGARFQGLHRLREYGL